MKTTAPRPPTTATDTAVGAHRDQRSRLREEAAALRDGRKRRVPAAELVPGDVLLLAEVALLGFVYLGPMQILLGHQPLTLAQ